MRRVAASRHARSPAPLPALIVALSVLSGAACGTDDTPVFVDDVVEVPDRPVPEPTSDEAPDAAGSTLPSVDAESTEEVEAKIGEALSGAAAIFDGETVFPGWSIVVAGPMSGTDGSTDVDNREIVVHANRDRTVEEFVVTILHEWGHVVDAERLTNDERDVFRGVRGFDLESPWSEEVGTHSIEEWGAQPSEDLAEVMVAFWTSDTATPHDVRTVAPGGPPDADTLAWASSLLADV